MSKGLNQDWVNALQAAGVTTFLMARLEFANETVFLWTGPNTIRPSGTGDTKLDGFDFKPMIPDVILNVGDNSYSMTDGSDAMVLSLGLSSTSHPEVAAAQAFPDEYQSRPAYIWRCLIVEMPKLNDIGRTVGAAYAYRRVRVGAMDQVVITDDGETSTFTLTIEGHATFATNVSGYSYLNQPKFDPSDVSQQYAVSIANGEPAPTKSSGSGWAGMIDRIKDAQAIAENVRFNNS